jgi:sec-independent protein translocase protein TatB
MQILNLGIGEIILVMLIMLIVLGPDRMVSGARQVGRFASRVTKSPLWAELLSTSREIRELPTRIVREAGMEETIKEIQQETNVLAGEINDEVAQAAEQVNAADQELKTVSSDIARHSVPVPFNMSKKLDGDKPKEPEEKTEEAIEEAIPDPDERSILPPAIVEIGEGVSIEEDFVQPLIGDDEVEPGSPAESGTEDDRRDTESERQTESPEGTPPPVEIPDPVPEVTSEEDIEKSKK